MSASEANRSCSALLRQVTRGQISTAHSHGWAVANLTPVSEGRSSTSDAFPVLKSNAAAWRGAMGLCVAHQLASWDALVLNVAAESGARLLLTEGLHAGFCWRGVRVVNPLVEPADPLLLQLMGC